MSCISTDLVQVEVGRELHVYCGERVDGDDGDARLHRDQAVVRPLAGALPVPDGAVEARHLVLLVENKRGTAL